MFKNKAKTAIILALAGGITTAAAAVWGRQAVAPPAPPAAAPDRKAASGGAAAGPAKERIGAPAKGKGRLLFFRTGYLTVISPDGKQEKQVSKDRGDFFPRAAWLSPDGRRIAYLVAAKDRPEVEGRDPRVKVYVRGLDEPEPGTDLKVEGEPLCWSPDGTHLVAVEPVYGKGAAVLKFVNWLVDVKTKEKKALRLPDNHAVQDWSRDGKHFLTTAYEFRKTPRTARLCLMNRDGTLARVLTDGSEPVYSGRLSPGGRKLLYVARNPKREGQALFVLDDQTGKSRRVDRGPAPCEFLGYCWSPDGRRIAYAWRRVHGKKDADQDTESALVVADADGRNAVTIASEKAADAGLIAIRGVDWR